MGFLSGTITFERYWVYGEAPQQFGPEHLEILQQHSIDRVENVAADESSVGFLAGEHLLDLSFALEKNIIGDALHFGVRIDSNQIPSAIRKAWLQLELATRSVDNPSGKPTKAQRQEAQEAVEARCQEEAASGRFRRMQHTPVLWDLREGVVYIGSTSEATSKQCVELIERAFDLELDRITSGKLAAAHAEEHGESEQLEEVAPTVYHDDEQALPEVFWWNGQSGNFDFLGNDFLLWLWWHFETQDDTIRLSDDSEVTGMFARSLSLECPRGETGKDTLSCDSPVHLPEAALAIRSGKLPRRAGLTLVRHGEQYDLAVQAETFAVSGAKIRTGETAGGGVMREDRLDSLRGLSETLDLLFSAYCTRRIGKAWDAELKQMRRWLKSDPRRAQKPAA